jgi:hypothetical protein
MEAAPPKEAKGPSIFLLRCLSLHCGALLAYEVDRDNFLYVDLAWTARRIGDTAYFPCPRCGGKNVVEAQTDASGRQRPRVARFEP